MMRALMDAPEWTPDSWTSKAHAQAVQYEDTAELERTVEQLRELPPLVTEWEVERLRSEIADAQAGKRFLLQGGDCAEMFDECRPNIIANRLKILLQMSVVLIQAGKCPVIRVGRFAGQYAKPRSKPLETRDGVQLPSYFGDLVNRPEFAPDARRADPTLLLDAYRYAALTLNYVRSLGSGGFSDLHHPEYWDLSFFEAGDLPAELRRGYLDTTAKLSEALRFMEALGEASVGDLTRVEFYTSHEGLSLHYESAQTRQGQQHSGWYDLTTHLPWIGERTRSPEGAHVEFFRGVRNPLGIKLGPKATGDDIVRLLDRLNPDDAAGKIVLITRLGAGNPERVLPGLVETVRREGRTVLWVCDPMHGNTHSTAGGVKTRNFDDILAEIEQTFEAHDSVGSRLGGVHFELTGDDVTECTGGGVSEKDLSRNYVSRCDPRLNYRQALEMAFRVGSHMDRRSERRSRAPGR